MRLPVELQSGERVVLLVRRHWYFLALPLTLTLLALIVPAALLLLIVTRTDGPKTVDTVATLLVLAYVLALAIRAYFVWYAWVHDVWVITNQRLVDGQKRNWFSQSVSTADLVQVQDIALMRHGFLATTLRFGDLRVQTAAEITDFLLQGIPKPQDVLTILDRTRDAARRDASATP